ncbi:MAG: hypothetical protein IGS03_09625 [Candidatus Sericytochromatia bacterium]|nr:hypothetical protein [Candidatus Sericytochromatia bacterium]
MNKRSLCFSALVFMLTTASAAQAMDHYRLSLPELESSIRLLQNYAALNRGMSMTDLNRFQTAEGFLKERQADQALTLCLSLRESYPEHVELAFLTADAWLATEKPEEALLVLESLESQLADKPVSVSDRLTLVYKQAQAYLQQNEPVHALKVFQAAELQPQNMSVLDQERFHMIMADLLFANQNYLGSYQQLQAVMRLPLVSDRGHIAINKIKPRLAALMHKQAKEAQFTRDYFAAETAAREAIRLDPNPIEYVHTLNSARQNMNREMQARFQRALPAIKNAMLNMRYALEIEDYPMLNREYMRFKSDRDTAFVLDENHRPYLPRQMYTVVEQVEKTLQAEGYQL